MTELENMYSLIAAGKEKGVTPPESILKQLEKMEDELILPALRDAIASILEPIQSNLLLRVDYHPDESVCVTIDRNYQEIRYSQADGQKGQPIPEVTDILLGPKEEPTIADSPKGGGFKVIFPDGVVVYERTDIRTFIESLKKMDLERINSSESCPKHHGFKVVDTRERPGKTRTQKYVDGYYILTQLKTEEKISDLTTISDHFGLGIKIEQLGQRRERALKTDTGETGKRAVKTKLRVSFPDDNCVITNPTAASTFVEAVKHMGLQRVQDTGIKIHGALVVSDSPSDTHPGESYLVGNRFVHTHGSTVTKQKTLKEIAERLKINMDVDIIPF